MDILNVVMRIEKERAKKKPDHPDWQVVEAMCKLLKEYSERVTKEMEAVDW